MFINKSKDDKNNICGQNVCKYRMVLGVSRPELADRLQIKELDVDKIAI